ncbi:MAG: hypothetical protein V7L21_19895 [Nostoc sp.]|uniref:hypothetical protein n=1 Tax=unclassified Nostoc TaxID=2593658 RepID=UPI0025D84CB9|nr:hypothetical protein [Nostoc sp. NMS9]MBN3944947.1 hypothetical protein [Nostoc sp. NMS9]
MIREKDQDFLSKKGTSLGEVIEYLLFVVKPIAVYLVTQLNSSTIDLDEEKIKSGKYPGWGNSSYVAI